MPSELETLRLVNKALWKLVETLLHVLATKSPEDVQEFIKELENLK